jgi:multidrug efflux pump
VFGGMLSATILAIFFIPLFFVVVMQLFRKRQAKQNVVASVQES